MWWILLCCWSPPISFLANPFSPLRRFLEVVNKYIDEQWLQSLFYMQNWRHRVRIELQTTIWARHSAFFCPLRLDFAAQHHSAIQRLHVDVHNTARHHVSKMVGITLSLSCRVDGFNAMGLHRSVQIRHDGGALCAAFVFPLWLWKILDLNDIWVLYLWRVVARLHSGGLQAQVSIALLRCSLRGQTRIQVIFNSTAFASY